MSTYVLETAGQLSFFPSWKSMREHRRKEKEKHERAKVERQFAENLTYYAEDGEEFIRAHVVRGQRCGGVVQSRIEPRVAAYQHRPQMTEVLWCLCGRPVEQWHLVQTTTGKTIGFGCPSTGGWLVLDHAERLAALDYIKEQIPKVAGRLNKLRAHATAMKIRHENAGEHEYRPYPKLRRRIESTREELEGLQHARTTLEHWKF